MSTARLRQTTLPVTSKYGPRALTPRAPHKGTDFPFGSSVPVSSFGAGRVTFAGRAPYYIPGTKKAHPNYERGIYVEVEHAPGIATSYHSLSRTTVKAGDWVELGQTVGYGGRTAVAATGDHCHVGFWLNGQHRDLEKYLTPGVIVTVSNDGAVSSGAAVSFDNSTPAALPTELIQEDDMYTDDDRKDAAETLRLLRTRNLPVLVKTATSNKVWLSDLVCRRLVATQDELNRVAASLRSRSLSADVNTVADLDVFGVPVLTDAQRKSLTQAQIDGDA